ncbi:MAG TPA: trypsin-like serine protease [Gaiellaceae bacterium]|nr:trypsin-like serine protease [Gaiellaceae bacterium]
MRKVLALFAMLAAATFVVPASQAITDGELDGNGHPYVGLMVAQTAGGTPLWRCSGTLVSAELFVTAGHCTEPPAAHIEIWFDDGSPIPIGNPGNDVPDYPFVGDVGGTPFTHPDYNPNAFFLRDLGVVELDAPMVMPTYGTLPGLNSLDTLKTQRGKQETTFTAVGYGLQKSFPDAAAWKESALRTRMVAHPHLIQINGGLVGDFSLLLSNNAHSGGTCFGDSGGPNFLGNSNVIAGVTSFGLNGNCAGTGGVFRLDRSWSLDFINDHL